MIRRFVRRLLGKPQPVVYTRDWNALSAEQIARNIASWEQTEAHWRTLWDWLGEVYQAEMLTVMTARPDPNELLVWTGRLQMLMHLRSELLEKRAAGRKADGA